MIAHTEEECDCCEEALEWQRQHENALASWNADVANMNSRITELRILLDLAEKRCDAIDSDRVKAWTKVAALEKELEEAIASSHEESAEVVSRDMRIAALEAKVKELGAEKSKAMQLLWLTHGHVGLYGDDGEQQCGVCGLDFKRMSPAEIEASWQRMALAKALASEEKQSTSGIWCPVYGNNGCRHEGKCVGAVCVAADRNEGPLLNKEPR